ncbi:MAG: FecR/PupR family sigma factor regulator [Bacteroides sp.]|nr:FecR/PupR family sigma factor regulator [Bacteroides sp.]
MINKQLYIAELISSFLSGSITPEEEIRLKEWRESSPDHERLFQNICSTENFEKYFRSAKEYDNRKGWEQLNRKISLMKRRNYLLQFSKYAAILILPFFIVFLWFIH